MDDFDELSAHPTAEGMLALGWGAFERFVGAVFARAGYTVEYVALRSGSGADLALYVGSAISPPSLTYVSVKHVKPPNVVAPAEVRAFGAALAALHAPGYLVSAIDLTPAALAEAAAFPQLRVLAGKEWERYVLAQKERQSLPHHLHRRARGGGE